MSILELNRIPPQVFDAANAEHRLAYAQFLSTKSWGRVPVRFIIDDNSQDLPHMIERKLAKYYLDREFSTNPKTPRAKK